MILLWNWKMNINICALDRTQGTQHIPGYRTTHQQGTRLALSNQISTGKKKYKAKKKTTKKTTEEYFTVAQNC